MFTVFKDSDSGPDSPAKPLKMKETKKRRSLSADPFKPKQSDTTTRSTTSSPTKRQLLDTPKTQDHESNKENWDPVLKLYSTDRQAKKYRSFSTSSMVQGDRIPLADITFLFQSRLEEARLDHEDRQLSGGQLPGRQNQVKLEGKEIKGTSSGKENKATSSGKERGKLIEKERVGDKKVAKRESVFRLSDKTNTVDTKTADKQPLRSKVLQLKPSSSNKLELGTGIGKKGKEALSTTKPASAPILSNNKPTLTVSGTNTKPASTTSSVNIH